MVVSAFHGVTNQLLDARRLAERGDAGYLRAFDQIARRHRAAVDRAGHAPARRTRKQVDALLDELGARCRASTCFATVRRARST